MSQQQTARDTAWRRYLNKCWERDATAEEREALFRVWADLEMKDVLRSRNRDAAKALSGR